MSWASAVRKPVAAPEPVQRPLVAPAQVNWAKLVTLDFETFYDQDYTLKKLPTSQYVRDPRFEAQMMGLKIGERPARLVHGKDIARELAKIDWSTHAVLAHHAQFDGLILSHHYGVVPQFYYCSLSMARGWLSNDIGAGLDEVSRYFGRQGKLEEGAALAHMRGIRLANMHPDVFKQGGDYCLQDTEECYAVFREHLLEHFPQSEIDLIDATVQMFTCPVLRLDEPRAQAAMDKEIAEREALLDSVADPHLGPADLDNTALRELTGQPAATGSMAGRRAYYDNLRTQITPFAARQYLARKIIGSSEKFADLLRREGVEPPVKVSPAWIKRNDGSDEGKYTYAFAKDDLAMQELLSEHPSARVRDLCEARLAIKSNITITRAGRLLEMAKNGNSMPVYYKYAAAHTMRFGGGDKCLTGDTMILVRRAGATREIELQHLRNDDLVWDGEEFVSHDGLVCRGNKEVMTYQGVTGTPDHKVFIEGRKRPVPIEQAASQGLALQSTIRLDEWIWLRKICQGAKARCTQPSYAHYEDYGGRGITFEFVSASAMAEWVLKNLGQRPSTKHSLDRIDNNKGYTPGNLRWATAEIQAGNKRPYRWWKYGTRLQRLLKLKPEFGYERLREFITQGMTDEQILARVRTNSGRPRLRHSELRPPSQVRR